MVGMEAQFAFASRDDLWRLQNEIKGVYTMQTEHSERISRLERRQEEDSRLRSVWGSGSPFPSILGGTPQQGKLYQNLLTEPC
jgi:ubiquitin carboxyl-terminal hydrolase 4/11/15